jgi:hypothetical protein
MDASGDLVGLYLRYGKRWFIDKDLSVTTGHDISILAIDPVSLRRYHVEIDIGRVPTETTNIEEMKTWLVSRFGGEQRESALMSVGFTPSGYSKILVTRNCSALFKTACEQKGVEVWLFYDIVMELRAGIRKRVASLDHEGRLIQLLFYPPKNASAGA